MPTFEEQCFQEKLTSQDQEGHPYFTLEIVLPNMGMDLTKLHVNSRVELFPLPQSIALRKNQNAAPRILIVPIFCLLSVRTPWLPITGNPAPNGLNGEYHVHYHT